MKVLILGGNGYIGSKLDFYLSIRGIETFTYGNRREDYNLLTSSYFEPFDVVILLAGHSSVPSCNGNLRSAWNNNVRNFTNLVEKIPKKKLIYASSSSVYGTTQSFEATEDMVCSSYVNNYDLSKVVLDQFAQNFINMDRQIIGLRFGTVNGVSSIIRRELLVNSMTYSAVTNKKIVITNRHIFRPFLDIYDLCRAIYQILRTEFTSGIYNLVSDNMRIEDYAEIVSDITKAEIVDNGTTPGVYDFSISSNKFKTTFGFEFHGKVGIIVPELIDAYVNHKSTLVTRSEYFNYEG